MTTSCGTARQRERTAEAEASAPLGSSLPRPLLGTAHSLTVHFSSLPLLFIPMPEHCVQAHTSF